MSKSLPRCSGCGKEIAKKGEPGILTGLMLSIFFFGLLEVIDIVQGAITIIVSQ